MVMMLMLLLPTGLNHRHIGWWAAAATTVIADSSGGSSRSGNQSTFNLLNTVGLCC
jgi:hypothetical protein